MAILPIHKYFIFNDEVQPNNLFIPAENEGGIYEVLRVKDGIPLFLEDHLQRFKKSSEIARRIIPYTEKKIKELLSVLINRNEINEGNILISFKINMKAFFIEHTYPTTDMYKNGVICGILEAERENPNAKVFQTTVRQKANNMIAEKGFYEVLLADSKGCITEGSRSNVFFVQDNTIVTAQGNKVLLGITRQKAIELAKLLNLEVVEREIFLNELPGFQAAFISGTSPKILPISQVESVEFNVADTVLKRIMGNYDLLIEEYISARRICNNVFDD